MALACKEKKTRELFQGEGKKRKSLRERGKKQEVRGSCGRKIREAAKKSCESSGKKPRKSYNLMTKYGQLRKCWTKAIKETT